ncbi:hypothetical protein AAC387_Pa06g2450 [Persea americana]
MRPLEGFTDNKAMHPIESQDNIYHGMCPLFLPGLRYSFMYFSGSFVRQPFFYLLSRGQHDMDNSLARSKENWNISNANESCSSK